MKAKIKIEVGNSTGVQPLFLETVLRRVYNVNGIFTNDPVFDTILEARNILFQVRKILRDVKIDHVANCNTIMLRTKAKLYIEKI